MCCLEQPEPGWGCLGTARPPCPAWCPAPTGKIRSEGIFHHLIAGSFTVKKRVSVFFQILGWIWLQEKLPGLPCQVQGGNGSHGRGWAAQCWGGWCWADVIWGWTALSGQVCAGELWGVCGLCTELRALGLAPQFRCCGTSRPCLCCLVLHSQHASTCHSSFERAEKCKWRMKHHQK